MKQNLRYCDGLTRRDFVRVGAVGLLGIELGLPALLARREIGRASCRERV